jgi:hypothetical protein
MSKSLYDMIRYQLSKNEMVSAIDMKDDCIGSESSSGGKKTPSSKQKIPSDGINSIQNQASPEPTEEVRQMQIKIAKM